MTEQELYNEYRESDCKSFTDFLINKIAELKKTYRKQRNKRIDELQKENELLKGRTGEFEKQILGLLYKYESVYKRFPDLKDAMNEAERILKENAELKEALKGKVCNCMTYFNFKDLEKQLTKAKEIIKTILGFMQTFGYSPSMDKFIADAEQFLSEVEK